MKPTNLSTTIKTNQAFIFFNPVAATFLIKWAVNKNYSDIKKQVLLFLLSVVFILSVKAQNSCVIGSTTVTVSSSINVTPCCGFLAPSQNPGGCPSGSYTGSGFGLNGNSGDWIQYTFSNPITSARIGFAAVNLADIGVISVNTGASVTLSNPCNFNVSGNQVSGVAVGIITETTTSWITVSAATPFTSIRFTHSIWGGYGVQQVNPCSITFTSACNATIAPTLSTNSISNTCPATSVNLNNLVTSATPTGTSLVWFTNVTGNAQPSGAQYTTPTAAGAGTYYSFYYDAISNCYSTATWGSTVTVNINTCITPVSLGTPATITTPVNTTVNGNIPSVNGGTAPYTYSSGIGMSGCTAVSGATALPTANLGVVNSSTGAHTINTTGLTTGTYYYCLRVCDASGTNCSFSRHTVIVTAPPCVAGTVGPVFN